jgi:hypothetical protein
MDIQRAHRIAFMCNLVPYCIGAFGCHQIHHLQTQTGESHSTGAGPGHSGKPILELGFILTDRPQSLLPSVYALTPDKHDFISP